MGGNSCRQRNLQGGWLHSRKREEDNVAGEQRIYIRFQPYLAAQGNHTGRPYLSSNRWKQANGGKNSGFSQIL